MTKSIKNQTFQEFLLETGFIERVWMKYKSNIKCVHYNTVRNIFRGNHDGKYNKEYVWRYEYFPTRWTIKKLSQELWITTEQLVRLIENQYKVNKKLNK